MTSQPDHAPDDAPFSDATPWRGRRPLRAIMTVAAASAAIAGLSLLAHESRKPAAPLAAAFIPSTSLGPRPAVAGAPRFRLDDPGALDPPRAEPPRRSPVTGAREDSIIQGAFEAIEAPFLRVIITDGDAGPAPSLFVTLARRAADGQGLSVARAGERGRVDTKFGPVETLEATLSGNGARICAGFATRAPGPVRLDGWLCAPLGQPPEPRAIVCALDKLVLNGQASPEIEAAIAGFDGRRDPSCRPRDAAETGSIGPRAPRQTGPRKNIEAKVRQNTQARP